MDIRPIRSTEDHARALRELERLWNRARPGTPDGDRFDVLGTLVDAWEREHAPIAPPDPIDAIRFRMEQQGLAVKDLLPVFKTTARASEILGKKRRLTLGMIRELHRRFDIPIDVLVSSYRLARPRSASPSRGRRAA